MDKTTLANKLTVETLKKYSTETLEEQYGVSGGKLVAAIFNEIYTTLTLESSSENQTVLIVDDIPRPDPNR